MSKIMTPRYRWLNLLASAVLALGLVEISAAANAEFQAKVVRVLLTADDSLGGCMALLTVSPASFLPSCGDGWVTFSCSGQFTDNVRAYRMLDQAQLALVTNRSVVVNITDQQQHGGFCFVRRLDILQ